MKFNPAEWDRMAAGEAGGGSWMFERAIELTAELATRHHPPPGLAVDVGCGSGRLVARLQIAGYRAVGVDIDPEMIRYAGSHPGRSGLVVAEAQRLPFAAESIALITASSLLGCLDSSAPFLTEAYRCLEPGGCLLATATNRSSWLRRLNYALPRGWIVPGPAGTRLRFASFTQAELLAGLESAGFGIETIHGYNFALHAGPWLFPPRPLARRLDALGWNHMHAAWARNFIAVARKPRSAGLRA